MQIKEATAALAALAHESRLSLFRLLVQMGPQGLAATKISEELNIPPSSLSFHLKELSYAALVTSRQEGRYIYYSANFGQMNNLMTYLTANCCGGNPCMPAIGKTCESTV